MLTSTGGCIVPLGEYAHTRVRVDGEMKRVDARRICGDTSDHPIHPGLSRQAVHAILPAQWTWSGPSLESCETINAQRSLFIAAWHGPYTWGIHDQKVLYDMSVQYGPDGLVTHCAAGTGFYTSWALNEEGVGNE